MKTKQRTRVCALLASAAMVCSMTSIPASAMSADTARFIKANNAAIPWGGDDPIVYAETLERLYYGNRPTSAISYYTWADDTSIPIDLNAVSQQLAAAPANPMSEYPSHGQSYAYTYDDAGHILSSSYTELPDAGDGSYVYVDEPYSLTSTFTYDAQGNASSRTDVGRDYDLDADSMVDVNNSSVFQKSYDGNGNLASELQQDETVTYTCDKYGRITDRTWVDTDGSTGTCHFTYKKGRLVKMAYSDADIVRTTTLTYDANKRLATALQWSGAPGDTDPEPTYYIFTYDAAGRLAEVTEHVSDGTANYRDYGSYGGSSWFIAYAY
jgi:YD repeat-containing protein